MSDSKRNVISVADYVNKIDSVAFISLMEGDIPIRIKRPSPKDSLVIMEMVQKASGEGMDDALTGLDTDNLTPEEKIELIRFSYDFDATLISSCCYHPDMDGDEAAETQSDNPTKIWEDKDDVLERSTEALFNKLRAYIKGTGVADQITEGEAGK